MARRGVGRRRVVIARMAKTSNRQVTFSKRRTGLFKKASELCTLCGVQILIVVFSPGGKAYSFGHPCSDALVALYLNEEPEDADDGTLGIIQAHRGTEQGMLNFHLTQLENLIEAECKRGEAVDQLRRATEGTVWWEQNIESLSLQQLEIYMGSMQGFVHNLKDGARRLQERGPAQPQVPIPFNPMLQAGELRPPFNPPYFNPNPMVGRPPMGPRGLGGPAVMPMANQLGVPFDPMVGVVRGQVPLMGPNGPGVIAGGAVPPMGIPAGPNAPHVPFGPMPYGPMEVGPRGGPVAIPRPYSAPNPTGADPNAPGPSTSRVFGNSSQR